MSTLIEADDYRIAWTIINNLDVRRTAEIYRAGFRCRIKRAISILVGQYGERSRARYRDSRHVAACTGVAFYRIESGALETRLKLFCNILTFKITRRLT